MLYLSLEKREEREKECDCKRDSDEKEKKLVANDAHKNNDDDDDKGDDEERKTFSFSVCILFFFSCLSVGNAAAIETKKQRQHGAFCMDAIYKAEKKGAREKDNTVCSIDPSFFSHAPSSLFQLPSSFITNNNKQAQSNPSLPVNYQPHDSLRLGLPAYKEEYAAPHAHPVAAVVAAAASSSASGDDARRNRALADVYGAGLAARMAIEKQILCR